MDNLKFKKGLEQNLPKELEKDTFYISTDSKKIRLNDAVWEDSEIIKSLINENFSIIKEIETVTAESLVDLNNKINSFNNAYTLIDHGINDNVFVLTPNVFHVWGEVQTLTLTLSEEQNNIANEYLFQFESGAESTILSLPSDIIWENGEIIEIESNCIYQVSILRNMATSMKFIKP